jgi:hypothetical protein
VPNARMISATTSQAEEMAGYLDGSDASTPSQGR